MRVIRGYKHDHVLVVDGNAYSSNSIQEAAANKLKLAGEKYPYISMPPFFFSGCPYADAILKLCDEYNIKPFSIPKDMDVAMLPKIGKKPAMANTNWTKIFNIDESLYYEL